MIVRESTSGWLLISQVEHARLAAEIADAWRLPDELAGLSAEFQYAVTHHDDGWADWEQAPTIDAEGNPRDFMEMPMPVAVHLWSDSIEVTARDSAWGALWVSRHFCHLADRALDHRHGSEDRAAVRQFLSEQDRLQQQWRTSAGPDATDDGKSPAEITGLHALQFFDGLSLWFCCAERSKPLEIDAPSGNATCWTPAGDGTVLVDAADFMAAELTLTAPTIAVPRTNYASNADLQAAIDAGTPGKLSWTLVRSLAAS